MVQREEMYFEPRCVGSDLRIRWYGEQYSAPELERHYEETVYIRDSGKELMVYSMEADCWDEKAKIKATFTVGKSSRRREDASQVKVRNEKHRLHNHKQTGLCTA